jgi:hypothetical protein
MIDRREIPTRVESFKIKDLNQQNLEKIQAGFSTVLPDWKIKVRVSWVPAKNSSLEVVHSTQWNISKEDNGIIRFSTYEGNNPDGGYVEFESPSMWLKKGNPISVRLNGISEIEFNLTVKKITFMGRNESYSIEGGEKHEIHSRDGRLAVSS